jgi:hypothetical protein
MKKIAALFLSSVMSLIAAVPAAAAPSRVFSYYNFQPDGTPYHYYRFGDEVFTDVRYDGSEICDGYYLEGAPPGTDGDGWARETLLINGQQQVINARYKLGPSIKEQYPVENRDMLLKVTAEGQNGPAYFDDENGVIMLYMEPGANLKAPDMDVVVTSLGYSYFHGPVWWSLTNDQQEKEALADLYEAGRASDTLLSRSNWDEFEALFNASMSNEADLSKSTWLTVCGGSVGGYFTPVFKQYRLLCVTKENPLQDRPSLVPAMAEFDKRLLYQTNVVFNFTDYTKKPVSFFINIEEAPAGAVTYSDCMCVVSRDYLSTLHTGDVILLSVEFDDGSYDGVNIHIKDTTEEAYRQVFSDVGTDTTAWEFIHPLVEMGVIPANAGGPLGPDETITYGEFYAVLAKIGAAYSEVPTPSAVIPAVTAEKLLFELLTSEAYMEEYRALNQLNLWQPNSHQDLTADSFAFLDMVLTSPYYRVSGEKPDEDATFTRAQSAETVYRFLRLVDYGKELIAIQQPTVSPNTAEIFIDSKSVPFEFYNIGGSNYLKLRDLAYALNGTQKQFGVRYDERWGYIYLTSGDSYFPVGGEMSAWSGGPRQASMTPLDISVDTYWSCPMAYNIGGYNYIKLRDLAEMLDFGVSYDEATRAVNIDTGVGYTQ